MHVIQTRDNLAQGKNGQQHIHTSTLTWDTGDQGYCQQITQHGGGGGQALFLFSLYYFLLRPQETKTKSYYLASDMSGSSSQGTVSVTITIHRT